MWQTVLLQEAELLRSTAAMASSQVPKILADLKFLKAAVRDGVTHAEELFLEEDADNRRKLEITRIETERDVLEARLKAASDLKTQLDLELKDYQDSALLTATDPQTGVYGCIHAYVTRYEAYLTAQATCWSRWRIMGSDAVDKSELSLMFVEVQEYERLAQSALRVLGKQARNVLDEAKTENVSPASQNTYTNKTMEDLELPRRKEKKDLTKQQNMDLTKQQITDLTEQQIKDFTEQEKKYVTEQTKKAADEFEYAVYARIACRYKTYRPFVIQRLVAFMGL